MSRMVWTPFILEAVERKKESGVSLKTIARVLGCSYESLRSARAHEVRRRAIIKPPVMLEAEALERIAKAGVSTDDKIRMTDGGAGRLEREGECVRAGRPAGGR